MKTNSFQLRAKDQLTLDNLRERWHGINESILDSGLKKPEFLEATTENPNPTTIRSNLVSGWAIQILFRFYLSGKVHHESSLAELRFLLFV